MIIMNILCGHNREPQAFPREAAEEQVCYRQYPFYVYQNCRITTVFNAI